ncbi:MAG: hypothetical protein GF333_08045 [Candidatus Omnitrophica bacterium]|nr:hypothetical protein [Candidatus Omnitrophota bacterium]
MVERIVTGEVYHTYTRSIAEFVIFNNQAEYARMISAMRHFQWDARPLSFSRLYRKHPAHTKKEYVPKAPQKRVQIIAYCIMPTHIHLVLKQKQDNGISAFLNDLLNSYTRYFNTKRSRKGPLWEGRFKKVYVQKDEQLLHLTRYIHLNPVTAGLVKKPEQWKASSYREFIGINDDTAFCEYDELLEIVPAKYAKSVMERRAYQRELAKIKHFLRDSASDLTGSTA